MTDPEGGSHRLTDEVGTVRIGDRDVRRLGFGAMRISGARTPDGVRDRATAIALVRGVHDHGMRFLDAANIYGYGECEEIIAEALHPYPDDLLIGTKAGFEPGKLRPGMTSLPPLGRPEHIRQECEKSLRRLRLDCIEFYQVHVPDPAVPYAETVGAFADLQREGKVCHIGVSNVDLPQLEVARGVCEVVAVQNRYNVAERRSEPVLDRCEELGIPFIPHTPLVRDAPVVTAVLQEVAGELAASPRQVAIAWLLARSPVMAPIPGTSDLAHALHNVEAARVTLTSAQWERLDSAARGTTDQEARVS
ncbi:aldo/keto reductase [Pseudonocardia kunmingensis]|uniref:Aryl-alcohol dehydrogenase-like predicted oxidoreductase n=1 Tax=Pseudonocardia kunmingensis TaxID=630975 RepID=A0A543DPJ8_9PSEU|nr:aldo/keto reductase [Pseudonocardia kunmingensis]TQM11249.1 aryl-alcohol dehydrogenase-like predicted oxidoreductase [Pseudonocardia kunmingensis]